MKEAEVFFWKTGYVELFMFSYVIAQYLNSDPAIIAKKLYDCDESTIRSIKQLVEQNKFICLLFAILALIHDKLMGIAFGKVYSLLINIGGDKSVQNRVRLKLYNTLHKTNSKYSNEFITTVVRYMFHPKTGQFFKNLKEAVITFPTESSLTIANRLGFLDIYKYLCFSPTLFANDLMSKSLRSILIQRQDILKKALERLKSDSTVDNFILRAGPILTKITIATKKVFRIPEKNDLKITRHLTKSDIPMIQKDVKRIDKFLVHRSITIIAYKISTILMHFLRSKLHEKNQIILSVFINIIWYAFVNSLVQAFLLYGAAKLDVNLKKHYNEG